jgi:hypothetical protein
MQLTQRDYETRKARVESGQGDDNDRRLVKHYEREGFAVKAAEDKHESSKPARR